MSLPNTQSDGRMRSSENKILFFTLSDRVNPSTRYRVYHFLPFLEKNGMDVRVMAPEEKKGAGLRRFINKVYEERCCLQAAHEADTIFIQRRLFTTRFLRNLKSLNKKIIFDFDDAIFTSPNGDWSYPTQRKISRRMSTTLKISDWVLAGNPFLRSFAEKTGATRVVVLPTAVNVDRYGIKKHDSNHPITLGWMGTSHNYRFLELLKDILPPLAEEFPGLKFLVVSDHDFQAKGISVENRRWSEETENRDLLDMDIGLMPLADNEWTLGKCALKAIQYMASGIPAVCSNVGANREVVEDGVNGFLPKNHEGWLTALRELIRSPEKRTAMGLAGRKMVEKNYNVRKTAEVLIQILEQP